MFYLENFCFALVTGQLGDTMVGIESVSWEDEMEIQKGYYQPESTMRLGLRERDGHYTCCRTLSLQGFQTCQFLESSWICNVDSHEK